MNESAASDPLRSLYVDHHGWLQSWLRRKTGCSEQAADLAQDTFVRVLRTGGSLEPIRTPRAYLTRIAGALVIDHWRRRELERAYLEALANLPEPQAPSPEQRWLILEALLRIEAMLRELKPRTRQAFLLAQLEGLKCPQIAERLGVSLATVERDIAKALKHCYVLRFEDGA